MFSATVRVAIRLKCWKIIATLRRSACRRALSKRAMSSPSISTWPSLGLSRRLIRRSNEDLPAPLRPMMPKISPRWTCRSMSCKALSAP
ncbi:hypothetical protein D3C72_1931440 [compost metagenome]